ncbi:hydrogenase maturation nickel metallochaperone HypA [Prochlorothrix hollandica]|uniref:Hydrogenase maturation factor HypA n=1 Tax=Prochlorothrix hollandica PCC 9006 = CALU 1027 TaxID=317619 RepID=A0A0M2PUR6_PROHO|nr:hydrogenase maturation nickel metallochaperone HypA [Prochlorothrix hollandica]KKI99849.1 hydrogenase nickel incorporation protein HypA [Prochlorothrix hollandica PCC 9006 = CALU 1027]
MHETDMTKALILTVQEWRDQQPTVPTIAAIHLVVGQFTCVEPASLEFTFAAQTQNTFLEGVRLAIEETPLIAFCHRCQAEYRPNMGLNYACPTCQSPMEEIRSGRELKIDRIEYSAESA